MQMWFEDEKISGRGLFSKRRGNRRRNPILMVNPRSGTKRRAQWTQTAVYFFTPLALLAVVAAVWIALHVAGRRLFSENSRFKIAQLDFHGGGTLSAELIREYTQIREGMNLFDIDINTIRSDFLSRAPNVRAMTISRHLPDTIRIEVMERDPLARMGYRGHLVVDRDGHLFGKGRRARPLPVIIGYSDNDLQPGKRVGGIVFAALELLEVCDDPVVELVVDSVDVSNTEALTVLMRRGGVVKRVSIKWDDMGLRTDASQAALYKKLGRVRSVWDRPEGRQSARLNATYEGQVVGE
jgi:hypothetical protein